MRLKVINWSIFMVSLAILIGLSVLHNQRFERYVQYVKDVEHSVTIVAELNKIQHLVKETESGIRGALLLKDSAVLREYRNLPDTLNQELEKLLELTHDHPLHRERLQSLRKLIEERFIGLGQTSEMFFNADPNLASSISEGRRKMFQCDSIINTMKREEQALLGLRNRDKEFYESVTPDSFLLLFFFTIITFITSFAVIIQQYRRRLKYQQKLEQKIIELNQSNNELQQIAYLASHDLQEPLRKISTFSDKLETNYARQVDPEGKRIIGRIRSAAERMRDLVEDLAKYTTLIEPRQKKEPVDLQSVLTSVTAQYKPLTERSKATIIFNDLPVIEGIYDQIILLFECLVDNSLKFVRPGIPPLIEIRTEPIGAEESKRIMEKTAHSSFVKIVFRDNGIGFDNEFAERVFGIFKRLHGQQSPYEGKGVGLAIVKRVISNHNGFVTARGKPMEGAEFVLYFPTD